MRRPAQLRFGLEHCGRQGSRWFAARPRGIEREPLRIDDIRAANTARREGQDDACGCDRPRPRRPPQVRALDGTWLARALGDQLPELWSLQDQTVDVEEDAWWALQALLRQERAIQARVDRLERRRARIGLQAPARTPELPDTLPTGGRALSDNACGCATVRLCPARYVDRTSGDDMDSGGLQLEMDSDAGRYRMTLRPWKTLRRVEDWLANGVYGSLLASADTTCLRRAYVYLKRGETWDGTEEEEAELAWESAGEEAPVTYVSDWSSLTEGERGDYAALTLQDLKGVSRTDDEARSARVLLSSYGDASLALPVIDGMAGEEPQYDDRRIGILVLDCCYLGVTDLEVRGFGTAIDVRGACYDHLYSGLTLQDNGIVGLAIGVDEKDTDWYIKEETDSTGAAPSYADACTAIAAGGLYPDQIRVEDCTFTSNGYDTRGADLALNFMATNCTISNNTMTGDDTRGVDGIVAQVPSSGHLIEGNVIGRHNKYCYTSNTNKTVITTDSAYCSGGYTLLQGCADPGVSCLDQGFGYEEQYYDPLTALPSADVIEDGEDAFAEDGIDFKGVRSRTSTSADVTVIRDNIIFGHTVGERAGINISDGSVNIHIYNNRIFLNAKGILVTNQGNSHPAHGDEDTTGVYIYRNLIYLNQEQGIAVKSEDADHLISQVWIVNNTIAHNLLNGVLVLDDEATTVLDHVYLYNNLIARNGIGAEYDEDDGNSLQINWSGNIDLSTGTSNFGSDYNCYLGWERSEDDKSERVIRARIMPDSEFEWLTVEDAQDSGTLGIEASGMQPLLLADLYLADEGTFDPAETSYGSTEPGDNLSNSITSELSALSSLDVTSATGVHTWDYTPTSASSPLVDSASTTVGEAEAIYHYDTGTVIPLGPDLDGETSTAPDIGALEYV